MAASAGHAVAYTIGPILITLSIVGNCISPMASRILSFVNCLWLVGITLISSASNNAIFINRAQNIECSFGYMARSAVLLKPNVANILVFNFCEQKFVQHGPITIAIDYNALSVLIFEEKWPNYASGPKSAPCSDSFWVRRLFNVCVRVFCPLI